MYSNSTENVIKIHRSHIWACWSTLPREKILVRCYWHYYTKKKNLMKTALT